MGWRRYLRAILVGSITFIFGLIYVPQCRVQVYAENATPLSLLAAAAMTVLSYKFP